MLLFAPAAKTRCFWHGSDFGWQARRCCSSTAGLSNAPPWDFGRLGGVGVVFVFLSAQVLAITTFGQWPDRGVWLGGTRIICRGIVIAMSAP